MLRAWHLEPSGRYFLEDVQNDTLVHFLFVSVDKNKNIRKKQSTQYYPYNKEKISFCVLKDLANHHVLISKFNFFYYFFYNFILSAKAIYNITSREII